MIGGNVSDLVVARNCCMARMLPGEAELVSEWTGLPGEAKSVKRFERSNGLDTALYKNYRYLFLSFRPLFFYFLVYGFPGSKNRSVGKKKKISKGPIMSSCRKKLPVGLHGNSNKKWCVKKLLNTLNIIKVVTRNYSNISKRNKGNI